MHFTEKDSFGEGLMEQDLKEGIGNYYLAKLDTE